MRPIPFALLAALIWVAPVAAQPDADPHPPLDGSGEMGDLTARLTARFGARARRGEDNGLLRRLLENAAKRPEDILKAMPELQNPETIQRLLDRAKGEAAARGLKLPQAQVDAIERRLAEARGETAVPQPPREGESAAPFRGEDGPTGATLGASVDGPTRPAARPDERTREWLRWFERNVGPLEDFPSFAEFLRDAGEGKWDAYLPEGFDWRAGLDGWRDEIDGLRQWLGDASKSEDLGMGGWSMPTMPSVGFGVPGGSSGGWTLPRAEEGTWLPVLLLGAAALVGMGFWYRAIRRQELARRMAPPPGLGEWPVDPERIATPEELVRAVDYLTLSRCGLAAESWHHARVAAALAERFPSAAALLLAERYESARYAPDGSRPTAEQVAEAGRVVARLRRAVPA